MITFRQTLLDIRASEMNTLLQEHHREIRAMMQQVDVEAIRAELYTQAGRLMNRVEAVVRIPAADFLRRHRTYLELKRATENLLAFYATYPAVCTVMEKLQAVFTGMILSFNMSPSNEFVFSVSAVLASPSDQIDDFACCWPHESHPPEQHETRPRRESESD